MMQKVPGYFLVHVLVAAVLLCGFTATAGAADPPEEVGPATITIVPMSGAVKTKLTIYGAGFAAGEKVKVIMNVGGVPLQFGAKGTGGIVVANEHGAFKLQPRGGIPSAPAVVKPGVYTMRAVGDKGSKATAVLEVLEKKK